VADKALGRTKVLDDLEFLDAHASVISRVDALIARGVVTENQRAATEGALLRIDLAGTRRGDARTLQELIAAVSRPAPVQTAINRKRVAVIKALGARTWDRETQRALRKADPKFQALTEADFEAAREQSLHGWAATLSCKCGAFNDSDRATAKERFASAAREVSRKPRSRAKR
jgi:hypothetical protein